MPRGYAVVLSVDGRVLTGSYSETGRLWVPAEMLFEPGPRNRVVMACRQLADASAPLAFTHADAQIYPVLRREPEDPGNSDLCLSFCKGFLPD